ncbi:hypothetical protein IP81_03135 [Novosphingobium sp. AAP83]|nr:hypothetical protein IP81_03135 [Novosphingobium sp. AAP83]
MLAVACSAQAEVGVPIAAVSYQADIVPLIESQCATCHLTGEEAGGMSLVGDVARDFLVGQPSQEAPAIMRVVAGDPDASYLVMKLEGTHLAHAGSGGQMPFGAPPLDAGNIAKVRQWIADGAKP